MEKLRNMATWNWPFFFMPFNRFHYLFRMIPWRHCHHILVKHFWTLQSMEEKMHKTSQDNDIDYLPSCHSNPNPDCSVNVRIFRHTNLSRLLCERAKGATGYHGSFEYMFLSDHYRSTIYYTKISLGLSRTLMNLLYKNFRALMHLSLLHLLLTLELPFNFRLSRERGVERFRQ